MTRSSIVKSVLTGSFLFAALIGLFAHRHFEPIISVGAGFKAKLTCSEYFLAHRKEADIAAADFTGIDPALDLITVDVDPSNGQVTAHGPMGIGKSVAYFMQGRGCSLRAQPPNRTTQPTDETAGSTISPKTFVDDANNDNVGKVLKEAFSDKQANHRAILVVQDGKIIAEHYATGFSKNTRFQSWSMAKSVIATLVGAAALKGYLDIDDPAPVEEWTNDPEKSAITWDDLLRMQSGLAFEEDYANPLSDVNQMLFTPGDTGLAAAIKPVIAPPGDVWYYSSGTSNLIARTLKAELAARGIDLQEFAATHILAPIGADSFILEEDQTGTPVGSSFVYATARDWARLGALYLADGNSESERLLPEGWNDYVASETAASNGQYGAHFWLNRDGTDGRRRYIPDAPEDIYFMSGHEGQFVFIIPDKNLIIVRTGRSLNGSGLATIAPIVGAVYQSVSLSGP